MFEKYPKGTKTFNNQHSDINYCLRSYEEDGKFLLDSYSCPVGSLLAQRIIMHLNVEDAKSLKNQLEEYITCNDG